MEYVLARDSGNCQIERYFFTPSSSDFLEDELTRNKIKDLPRFPHSNSEKKDQTKVPFVPPPPWLVLLIYGTHGRKGKDSQVEGERESERGKEANHIDSPSLSARVKKRSKNGTVLLDAFAFLEKTHSSFVPFLQFHSFKHKNTSLKISMGKCKHFPPRPSRPTKPAVTNGRRRRRKGEPFLEKVVAVRMIDVVVLSYFSLSLHAATES